MQVIIGAIWFTACLCMIGSVATSCTAAHERCIPTSALLWFYLPISMLHAMQYIWLGIKLCYLMQSVLPSMRLSGCPSRSDRKPAYPVNIFRELEAGKKLAESGVGMCGSHPIAGLAHHGVYRRRSHARTCVPSRSSCPVTACEATE